MSNSEILQRIDDTKKYSPVGHNCCTFASFVLGITSVELSYNNTTIKPISHYMKQVSTLCKADLIIYKKNTLLEHHMVVLPENPDYFVHKAGDDEIISYIDLEIFLNMIKDHDGCKPEWGDLTFWSIK
ncbi:hypothetical protein HN924_03410 [Candidatus Woesearchaeota archaeon]|jgi:hypothetical protein|nr:hypothetical protein [Candidatus Woesearchaeota archaeon]MBT7062990.1 hypothetical protein [Candidatus Woesearchaeota archaeon]MBT7402807.1 hypothetical protein [Candidatus Woesearchaeota archaeon]